MEFEFTYIKRTNILNGQSLFSSLISDSDLIDMIYKIYGLIFLIYLENSD